MKKIMIAIFFIYKDEKIIFNNQLKNDFFVTIEVYKKTVR